MADNSSNFADIAASLLSKLSGGVELSCAFDQVELQVPNAQNPSAPAATWKLNGSVRIRTRGDQPGAPLPPNSRLPAPKPVPSTLEIDAQLVITWNGHPLQLAAAGTYLILNIPSQQVLDELTAGPPKAPGAPRAPKAPGPDPLQQINDLARQLGWVLDLRVGGKTYVTFGVQRTPKITLNAVLGKIGSFFK